MSADFNTLLKDTDFAFKEIVYSMGIIRETVISSYFFK